ncbi:hypothetical protein N9549_00500 [Acidimicrobiales bacterium]|jgi:hypothetical protein|nr:hypothetical protein [Acidimicrobiales bacterium]
MNEYKALLDEGVVIFRFFDEYAADEGAQSLLRFMKSLTIDEKYSIHTLIWDLSDVTSMTLQNTDGARMVYFNKQMLSILQHPEKDPVEFLSNFALYYINPKDQQVRDVWVERVERLKSPTRTLPSLAAADIENLCELLTMLGLERLLPMLDSEWQTL